MKRILLPLLLLAVLVAVLLPPFFGNRSTILLATQMLIMATFAMSYNVLLGQTGLLSFGHAVYFGTGIFAGLYAIKGISLGALPLPLELVPLIGGLAGLFLAALFGTVSVKRGRIAFAMITLGLAELMMVCATVFKSVFGGEAGVSADRMVDFTLTGWGYGRPAENYWLVLVWAVAAIALMAWLSRTPLGRLANAVRDNDLRVEFLGYSPSRIRYLQFVLSGAFAGVAGGLFALTYEIANAEVFGLRTSSNVLIAAFLGGVGNVFGPALGAVVVTFLEFKLARLTEAWLLYYGLVFIAIVLFAPKGLWSLFEAIPATIRRIGLVPALAQWGIWAGRLAPGLVGGIFVIELANHRANAFDPRDPLMLFGQAIDTHAPLNWIIGLALVAASAALILRHRKRAAARHLESLQTGEAA